MQGHGDEVEEEEERWENIFLDQRHHTLCISGSSSGCHGDVDQQQRQTAFDGNDFEEEEEEEEEEVRWENTYQDKQHRTLCISGCSSGSDGSVGVCKLSAAFDGVCGSMDGNSCGTEGRDLLIAFDGASVNKEKNCDEVEASPVEGLQNEKLISLPLIVAPCAGCSELREKLGQMILLSSSTQDETRAMFEANQNQHAGQLELLVSLCRRSQAEVAAAQDVNTWQFNFLVDLHSDRIDATAYNLMDELGVACCTSLVPIVREVASISCATVSSLVYQQDKSRRARACQRICRLIPHDFDLKCAQALDELWKEQDFADWWLPKLFSDPESYEDIRFARAFMRKRWHADEDDFLLTWPSWNWHQPHKSLPSISEG